MDDKIVKKSSIEIEVGLNANNLPLDMRGSASDGDVNKAPARAFFLSLWNPEEKNTMKIDLWTKEMTIEEIATSLGITREATKARLHRARALMREYLTR